MAQANHVTNAIRGLITDSSPKTSTNTVRTAFAEPIAGVRGGRSSTNSAPKRPLPSLSESPPVSRRPAIVQDSAQHAVGQIDFGQGDRPFFDLAFNPIDKIPLAAWGVA
jgi:hypothetical protein